MANIADAVMVTISLKQVTFKQVEMIKYWNVTHQKN